MRSIILILHVSFLVFSLNLSAQDGFKSEEDLKQAANKLFEEEKLVDAEPLFAQLLALYPKDPNYNYKYGACLLATDSDKEKPLKFIEFATSTPGVDPLAFYYLGRTFHLNYNFAQAVKAYSKFKNKASSADKAKYQIERQIEMCKNGNNLLSKINDVQVLDKQVIGESDFYRIYDLKGIDGNIISKPEDFMSKYDKKNGEKSIIYLPKGAKEVYYSSYGNKGEAGRDIFKVVQLGSGKWSDPVNLGSSINTPYDENYAFIHPDGRTLYFASKGHSSMGGYDLFQSTFDNSINDWTAPVNLDFAFSSADDDVLFITDEDKALAFFASNRTNEAGKLTVYKVKVEKKAPDFAIIQGSFIAENNPSAKKAKITVIDKESNQTIGVYETDANGNYQVEIAENGGTYKFNIETTADAPLHTGTVTVPEQSEYAVLGQELRLVGEGEAQQLVIKNIFDGSAKPINTSGPQISSELLRKKASLDVNLNAQEILAIESGNKAIAENINQTSSENTTNREQGSEGSETNLNANNTSSNQTDNTASSNALNASTLNTEIESLTSKLEQQKSESKAAENFAYQDAMRLKSEANNLFSQLEDLKNDNTANEEQITFTEEEAKRFALQSAYALGLAKELESRTDLIDENQQKLNSAKQKVSSNELADADLTFNAVKNTYEKSPTVAEYIQDKKTELQEKVLFTAERFSSISNKKSAFETDKANLENQISALETEKTTANAARKTEIDKQISDYQLDKKDLEYQINTINQQYNSALQDESALQVELEQLENLDYTWKETDKTAIASISETEKENIVSEIKSYRDNNQLAFNKDAASLAALPNSAENTSIAELEDRKQKENEYQLDANESNIATYSNNSISEINKDFEGKINSSNSIADEDLRNAKKIELYNDWINQLDHKLGESENQLATANPEDEASINAEMESLLVQINDLKAEKLALSNEIAANSNDVTTANTNVTSNASNLNRVNQAPIKLEDIDVSQVDENSIIPENFTSLDFNQEFNYGNGNVRPTLSMAKKSIAQAATYGKLAQETRAGAYALPTVDARNEAFEKASEYERASERKQIEAAQVYSKVNAAEFQRNASLINNADNYGEGFESSNLDIAKLLADEAQVYYNSALELKAAVNNDDRLSKKQADLQKAYDFEMLALAKQESALKKLKIVDKEYVENPIGNVYDINAAIAVTEQAVAINDAQVLQINNSNLARSKGDSLNAVVESLNAEEASLTAKKANLSGEELAQVENQLSEIKSEKERTSKLAEQYYLRASQLDSKDDEIVSNIIKPASVTDLNTIAIDTVEISEARKANVINSPAYKTYLDNANKRERALKSAEIEYQKALNLAEEKKQLIAESNSIRETASEETDATEKERLIKSADVIDQRANAIQTSIDSINSIIKIKNFLIVSSENAMNSALANLDPIKQNEIKIIASKNISAEPLASDLIAGNVNATTSGGGEFNASENSLETNNLPGLRQDNANRPNTTNNRDSGISNETGTNSGTSGGTNATGNRNTASNTGPLKPIPSTTLKNLPSNIDVLPRVVKQAIFVKLAPNESAYSVEKPIPVDPTMPEGLVYKVQIGAFRNPIAQNLFKGFAPLMAEKVPNGITRYTAGVFVIEREAVFARNEIRKLGYPDAFVVAFLNGKRISISQARNQDNSAAGLSDATGNSGSSNLNNATPSNVRTSASGSKENLPQSFNATTVAPVVNAETISGVYYTVQIGVFSKPVPKGKLDAFQPLNVKVLASGLIRYNSGKFDNAVDANNLKESINKTISDAFVVAYYQGNRISLAEAARLNNR
ncbi:MAG: hypothetical protein DWP98_05215 [Bacteroidetes bacterium]|nr:MAG: hypothetical protein DWP98_05215 [Bacteroidota bacterium]MBL1144761.1 hypothetical protein [Bacteroidota bacterium]NOG57555.1 hypothetical protein [Bacteroidota bacterium]